MSILMHLSAAAAEAAPLATGTGPDIPWGRVLLAFLFCVALAIAAIGFLRVRNGMPLLPEGLMRGGGSTSDGFPGKASERMQIVQRLSITPTSQIIMLKRGKQNYILHVGNQGATEIDRFSEGQEPVSFDAAIGEAQK